MEELLELADGQPDEDERDDGGTLEPGAGIPAPLPAGTGDGAEDGPSPEAGGDEPLTLLTDGTAGMSGRRTEPPEEGDGTARKTAPPFWKALRRDGAAGLPAGGSAQPPGAETALGVSRPPEEVERGLEELYRKAVRADRPIPQAQGGEQGGRTVRVSEPEMSGQLTVDELDRAVKRDSWRYDGGMSIF